jgi:hypothetical protein
MVDTNAVKMSVGNAKFGWFYFERCDEVNIR